jgi:hypothetical protein
MKGHSAVEAIAWAGLTCGVLDGISAVIVSLLFGGTAIRVFQGIASGLLGRSAFQDGFRSALLGVALHFVVALGAASAYYMASRLLPMFIHQALLSGVIFGALVHLFMTFVVIPLSQIGSRPFVLRSFAAYLAVSMIVVGPSIALTIRRYARQ